MSTSAFQILRSIEIDAERANVQQIKSYIARIDASLPGLVIDDREYAQALLLKLDRLLCDQMITATIPVSADELAQSESIDRASELHHGLTEILREAA